MLSVFSLVISRIVLIAAFAAPPCLLPPVAGTVTDPFRPPGCPYCPGNRGIEYATNPGLSVTAAAAGVVGFAGLVAGVRYVVVDHPGGYRTTYGRLASISVSSGASIAAGQTVGRSGSATFFGLRLGDVYLDPGPHMARAIPQPRLVPLDGRDRRPQPKPKIQC